ncbi:MAG: hypothetical protein U0517_03110 [Candidatus Andersenbacteria bacterium]
MDDRQRLTEKACKWSNRLGSVPDSQEINISSMCHSSGQSTQWRSTAGELRELLRQALTETLSGESHGLICHFAAGHTINFDYHDYYDVEIVTPEVQARDDHKALLTRQIADLEALGVDRKLFVRWEQDGEETVEFSPQRVIELADIIRSYLSNDKE